MSISTKKGDEGMTSLIGGQLVMKCDDRVEAYGTVDEMSAFIGVLHDMLPESENETKTLLMEIQKHLLTVEAVFACPEEGQFPGLKSEAVELIESKEKELEAVLPPFIAIVIPGGNLAATYSHVCRNLPKGRTPSCKDRCKRRRASVFEQAFRLFLPACKKVVS